MTFEAQQERYRRVVMLCREGRTNREVSRVVGLAPQNVSRWKRKAREAGFLPPRGVDPLYWTPRRRFAPERVRRVEPEVHGTAGGYVRYRCRCDACRAAGRRVNAYYRGERKQRLGVPLTGLERAALADPPETCRKAERG
jgi:hypothetical protein